MPSRVNYTLPPVPVDIEFQKDFIAAQLLPVIPNAWYLMFHCSLSHSSSVSSTMQPLVLPPSPSSVHTVPEQGSFVKTNEMIQRLAHASLPRTWLPEKTSFRSMTKQSLSMHRPGTIISQNSEDANTTLAFPSSHRLNEKYAQMQALMADRMNNIDKSKLK